VITALCVSEINQNIKPVLTGFHRVKITTESS